MLGACIAVMPDIQCWETSSDSASYFWGMAMLGLLGLAIYALVIPVVLFKRLLRESRDEAEERFDPDFMESHGWLVRHHYRHLFGCGG